MDVSASLMKTLSVRVTGAAKVFPMLGTRRGSYYQYHIREFVISLTKRTAWEKLRSGYVRFRGGFSLVSDKHQDRQ
ncbi:hypothetical protein PHLCEN_2v10193 [Hermanssonia centrifuga]|uniref:Uncharacterized protein n=1 Tax=Hermanssonia centrifuga TaxID=98765 RepID=A0A2R6NPI3_9APHY|nr:hypothetical protein PHLCEN_2v10193 [Hermanssonia centrifuga]